MAKKLCQIKTDVFFVAEFIILELRFLRNIPRNLTIGGVVSAPLFLCLKFPELIA
ncbi:hypothetical protein HOLDEFILI_03568 [Holdemania filiformis DSM 12042]|uniref:Uncharacterized protein n=1 Tax=Holdemania filiformis DSM 12042 TaxID=545696 RepID=B9YCK7_9FIRM|nr:hypothetical protein HOLDEFILI_03568 [Holdemania filiformis DSM 12042]